MGDPVDRVAGGRGVGPSVLGTTDRYDTRRLPACPLYLRHSESGLELYARSSYW